MFKKINQRIEKAKFAVRKAAVHLKTVQLPTRKILCNRRGSGLVEYAGIAAAVLIIIVVVVLPAMKTMFNTDIFPGLTKAVENIFKFS